ncbi:MAG: glycoside hydrolase family 2 TIM barrel-domain containing protein [Verrucomicrobiota bacterium]
MLRHPLGALLAVLSLALPAAPLRADRETSDLLTGWKFIKQDVAPDAPTAAWQDVTLPHTWNNFDGQDGMKAEPDLPFGYYRGAGWYARALDAPAAWKGRRVFIQFEAASTVAQVYLNGHQLGEHRGSFTAFCYELTPALRFDAPNELRVRVDNSPFDDVPPVSGDFDIMGGIYRPVHLIVTDPVCITPLDSASPGVYLTTRDLGDDAARVEVKTLVSNGQSAAATAQVETTILDAAGQPVATQSYPMAIDAGTTKPIIQQLSIPHPHRWNGCKDPYLYTAQVRVSSGGAAAGPLAGGDSVTQPLGLRTVAISNARGFLLNGQPYPIHGVNCHQDRQDKGWAVSDADHAQDMAIMLEMGVTAIRLAHYPQSESVHELADHNGILLWNEIPLVNAVRDTPAFRANAAQELREMILQRYNHPSAVFWGLFNEMDKRLDDVATPVLADLKDEQQQLDPTRLSVAASCFAGQKFNRVPDWICFNPYFGWYTGTPDELTRYIDERFHENGEKRIGLSEYGAGANPLQHEDDPLAKPKASGQFHPEEWQTYVHERAWAQIRHNPEVWGSFLWCMFDFASDHRNEGGRPGLNDKGLVTADRRTRKDAYYFYQANWSDVPMVHLADRHRIVSPVPDIEVRAYTNCPQAELKLNGVSLGLATPDDLHICHWPHVLLRTGNNYLDASVPGTALTDHAGRIYNGVP